MTLLSTEREYFHDKFAQKIITNKIIFQSYEYLSCLKDICNQLSFYHKKHVFLAIENLEDNIFYSPVKILKRFFFYSFLIASVIFLFLESQEILYLSC